jgi:hypothetical protein
MFRKKQEPQNPTMMIQPSQENYGEEVQEIQPSQFQQQQMPQRRMPVQPMQPRKEARIIRSELGEDGSYIYVVQANYPLNLGWCSLEQ